MKIKVVILAVLALVMVLSGCGNGSNTNNEVASSNDVITDIEIDEAVNPDDSETEIVAKLSDEVVLPENINTEDFVDTANEIKASVSYTTREATKQYVQKLVDAGFNLDYEYEVKEGAQFALSTNDITVSVLFKNEEMSIYATKLE